MKLLLALLYPFRALWASCIEWDEINEAEARDGQVLR
jgi:hypothetical protein